jgi:hypothetical protein
MCGYEMHKFVFHFVCKDTEVLELCKDFFIFFPQVADHVVMKGCPLPKADLRFGPHARKNGSSPHTLLRFFPLIIRRQTSK